MTSALSRISRSSRDDSLSAHVLQATYRHPYFDAQLALPVLVGHSFSDEAPWMGNVSMGLHGRIRTSLGDLRLGAIFALESDRPLQIASTLAATRGMQDVWLWLGQPLALPEVRLSSTREGFDYDLRAIGGPIVLPAPGAALLDPTAMRAVSSSPTSQGASPAPAAGPETHLLFALGARAGYRNGALRAGGQIHYVTFPTVSGSGKVHTSVAAYVGVDTRSFFATASVGAPIAGPMNVARDRGAWTAQLGTGVRF